jgi:hypothetical protein
LVGDRLAARRGHGPNCAVRLATSGHSLESRKYNFNERSDNLPPAFRNGLTIAYVKARSLLRLAGLLSVLFEVYVVFKITFSFAFDREIHYSSGIRRLLQTHLCKLPLLSGLPERHFKRLNLTSLSKTPDQRAYFAQRDSMPFNFRA